MKFLLGTCNYCAEITELYDRLRHFSFNITTDFVLVIDMIIYHFSVMVNV